ncbi:hypothetical protein CH373_17610 [Leptospira perolatii]|uniref:Nif11 domain-containing protein n=1 Tax=Leptospira perolatii TaxID=2023191 RepID=A0A2M9ZIA7_9LEPT|nr:hypothetical protein [Leptospira perolatii]PJZ69089.1 hypothetical protein CH360_12455 [Leptospira perolatii]PJZ71798.1 hypothetical protein CH373_17610 [Leptospira perolatii]
MKNFIDFTIDLSKNPALGKEAHSVLSKGDATALSNWFASKGYTVSIEEAQRLVDNSSHLSQDSMQQSVKAGY